MKAELEHRTEHWGAELAFTQHFLGAEGDAFPQTAILV